MLIEIKESKNSPVIYTVLLPLLEGQFRSVLQGNDKNEIEICLESGDPTVETNQSRHMVYMHAGTDPLKSSTKLSRLLKNICKLSFIVRKKDCRLFLTGLAGARGMLSIPMLQLRVLRKA